MEWAIQNGLKIKAYPNCKAVCPLCQGEVISKCGEIKVHHWCHKSNIDCDDWYEPESQWCLEWKNKFPIEMQEVTMQNHRADIKTNKEVIELQNTPLSSRDIRIRENFYGEMVWLLNGETLCKGLNLRPKENNIYTFRWKNPPKSWWKANKPIYIDTGEYKTRNDVYKMLENYYSDEIITREQIEETYKIYSNLNNKIFKIRKIYPNIPCGGWGELITKEEFINGRY